MDQLNETHWSAERVITILRELASEEELPNHLVKGPVSGADTVESLGIDSIGAVTLVDRLESAAGVLLPDDFLDFNDSIDDIVQRMNTLK